MFSYLETDWPKFFVNVYYDSLPNKHATRIRLISMDTLVNVFLSDLIVVTPDASDQFLFNVRVVRRIFENCFIIRADSL